MAELDLKDIEAPGPFQGTDPRAHQPDITNLDALLGSLNSSAERFQTLWFSFLGLTLYLAITAQSTTHRMLLLGESLVLPFFNVKLELLAFFIAAPVFYVIVHFYVLMMMLLLGRASAPFKSELQQALPDETDQERYRARVENSLFLQLLIGRKPERSGGNGLLLALIALLTLVIAPIATLILMLMMFLPYHSLVITWWHRGVVIADAVLALIMWSQFFGNSGIGNPLFFVSPRQRRVRHRVGLAGNVCLFGVVLWLSFWEGRWAGEAQIRLVDGAVSFAQPNVEEIAGALGHGFVLGLFPDHLILPNERLVDEKLVEESLKSSVPTLKLRDRHLELAELSGADLRGVSLEGAVGSGAKFRQAQLDAAHLKGAQLQGADFREAQLQTANLSGADLQGANLSGARLERAGLRRASLVAANFNRAHLEEALLDEAELQESNLSDAQLQHANLEGAGLQNADLEGAELQNADLERAHLQRANLTSAELQGANLKHAELEDAILVRAELQGANLEDVQLQGADLTGAMLQGGYIRRGKLQGAVLSGANLEGAVLQAANLQGANLQGARLQGASLRNALFQGAFLAGVEAIGSEFNQSSVSRTDIEGAQLSLSVVRKVKTRYVNREGLEKAIKAATRFVTGVGMREQIVARFKRLSPDFRTLDEDVSEEMAWMQLEERSATGDPEGIVYRDNLVDILGKLACSSGEGSYVARALVMHRHLMADHLERFRDLLLAAKKTPAACPGVGEFSETDWARLERAPPLGFTRSEEAPTNVR